MKDKLLKHYGFTEEFQLLEKFKVDIIPADPIYIGPPLKSYVDNQGRKVRQTYWGYETTVHQTDIDSYNVTTYFPLNDVSTIEEVDAIPFRIRIGLIIVLYEKPVRNIRIRRLL
mgnify:CR=1 FL=1